MHRQAKYITYCFCCKEKVFLGVVIHNIVRRKKVLNFICYVRLKNSSRNPKLLRCTGTYLAAKFYRLQVRSTGMSQTRLHLPLNVFQKGASVGNTGRNKQCWQHFPVLSISSPLFCRGNSLSLRGACTSLVILIICIYVYRVYR